MRTRNKVKNIDNKSTRVKILRLSTYINIIEQLKGGVYSLKNAKLGCDYCHRQLTKASTRKKCKAKGEYASKRSAYQRIKKIQPKVMQQLTLSNIIYSAST